MMGWWADGALASNSGRMAAGEYNTCLVKADDTVACWSGSGAPAGVGTVTEVAAGYAFGCAIKTDDTPVCWGSDDFGQATVPDGIGTVTQLTAGTFHACAVKTDGTAVCWGADDVGQSTLPGDIGTVTQISAGEDHSCAIETGGTPVCWGFDDVGQGSVPGDVGTVTQISAGAYHNCAIETGGTPVCWGDDNFGQSTVPDDIGTVTEISAGGAHTCAIETGGTPVCWGRDAPIGPQPSLPDDTGPVTDMAAGGWHTCAIKADDSPVCWGSHIHGQLGGPPVVDSGPPPSLIGAGPFSHTYTLDPGFGGGTGMPVRFFVSDGELPPGLALDETTGELTGTPTAEGEYSGVVTATNDVFLPDDTQAFSITVDLTAPAAPTGLASTPASPSSDLTPQITGTAEAGSTVWLYDDPACMDPPLKMGSAAAFASPGLGIVVPADTTTTVYAKATDDAGNESACSSSGTSYVHETPDPPDPPDPPGPPGSPTPPGPPKPPAPPASGPESIVTRLTSNARCLGTARRARKDVTVRYTVGQAAKLTFSLQRRVSPKLAVRRACPRKLPAGDGVTTPSGKPIAYRTGTAVRRGRGQAGAAKARKLVFTRNVQAGRHSFKLLRAFETAAPKPGFYRLLVGSTTAEGEPGRAVSLYLWVLAPPRGRGT